MPRLYTCLLLSLCTAALMLSAMPLRADAPAATPLVIIRFNQHNVSFERSLYNAVNQALSIKKDTMFNVVLRPGLNSEAGNTDLAKVIAAIRKIGVPENQISSSTGTSSGERFDEVDVYVR